MGKQEEREFGGFLWGAYGLKTQEWLDAEQILIVKIEGTGVNSRSRKELCRIFIAATILVVICCGERPGRSDRSMAASHTMRTLRISSARSLATPRSNVTAQPSSSTSLVSSTTTASSTVSSQPSITLSRTSDIPTSTDFCIKHCYCLICIDCSLHCRLDQHRFPLRIFHRPALLNLNRVVTQLDFDSFSILKQLASIVLIYPSQKYSLLLLYYITNTNTIW